MDLAIILDVLYTRAAFQANITKDQSLYPVGYCQAIKDIAKLTNTKVKSIEEEKDHEQKK